MRARAWAPACTPICRRARSPSRARGRTRARSRPASGWSRFERRASRRVVPGRLGPVTASSDGSASACGRRGSSREDSHRCLRGCSASRRSVRPDRKRRGSWRRARGGRTVNYARRQQYRRLSHAGRAALGSVMAALLGLVVAHRGSGGARRAAAPHGRRAGPSRSALAFARWAQSGRRTLGGRGAARARPRSRRRGGGFGTRCAGKAGETSIRWRSRPPAWRSQSRRKRGPTTRATSPACTTRRRGSRDAGEGGHAAAPSASCASSVRGASSGSSTTFSSCRSTACSMSSASRRGCAQERHRAADRGPRCDRERPRRLRPAATNRHLGRRSRLSAASLDPGKRDVAVGSSLPQAAQLRCAATSVGAA